MVIRGAGWGCFAGTRPIRKSPREFPARRLEIDRVPDQERVEVTTPIIDRAFASSS